MYLNIIYIIKLDFAPRLFTSFANLTESKPWAEQCWTSNRRPSKLDTQREPNCALHLSLCSMYSLHPVLLGVTGQNGLELLRSGDTLWQNSHSHFQHHTANIHSLVFEHYQSTSQVLTISQRPQALHLRQTCCPGKMLRPEAIYEYPWVPHEYIRKSLEHIRTVKAHLTDGWASGPCGTKESCSF